MSNFALISTVDSMGAEFPSHCVLLFETDREAYLYAMDVIEQHEDDVWYFEEEGVWLVGDEYFHTASDALDEWQGRLDSMEYFHVKPVRSRNSNSGVVEGYIEERFSEFGKAYKYNLERDDDGFIKPSTEKAFIAFRSGFEACCTR